MATYTSNLSLKKPEGTEDINIADINGNMDILDKLLLCSGTVRTTSRQPV